MKELLELVADEALKEIVNQAVQQVLKKVLQRRVRPTRTGGTLRIPLRGAVFETESIKESDASNSESALKYQQVVQQAIPEVVLQVVQKAMQKAVQKAFQQVIQQVDNLVVGLVAVYHHPL